MSVLLYIESHDCLRPIADSILTHLRCFLRKCNDGIMKETPVITYQNALAKEKRSQAFRDNTIRYAQQLHAIGVPIVFSMKHLAKHLAVEYDDLYWMSRASDEFCKFFLISKKSGGKRRVIAPVGTLRDAQEWIKRNILDVQKPSNFAMGFVKEKSILDNAKPHENKRYILKCDISDFFESITFEQVYYVFLKIGYTKQVAYTLASLCTIQVGDETYMKMDEDVRANFDPLYRSGTQFLIQGAPTSPGLANLVCRNLDARLNGYCEKHQVNYTRYADDLTFSADNEEDLPSINFIKKILHEYGFALNEKKTQYLFTQGRQYVTGLLVDGRVRVPSKFKHDIYRHLHFCKKYGPRAHFTRVTPGKKFYREWLYGKILFVNAIEPEEARKMLRLAKEIDWLA